MGRISPKPAPAQLRLRQKAIADIPLFCAYLEQRLGLRKRAPTDFDARWLTREGLAQSRGEFDEFFEPGDWTVFLARDPNTYAKTFQPTSSADRSLSIGVGMFEQGELFHELGAKSDTEKNGTQGQPVLPNFPLLSRLSDIASDATYEPNDVAPFLAELGRAQRSVKEPRSIRGLDILIRITRWAEKLKLGIYFGGQ